MNRRTKIILCIVSAVLALGIAVYPLVSNFCSEKYRSLVETKYTKAVEALNDTEIIAAKEAAVNYNETLQAITGTAYSKDALQQATESYDELLNIRGDGIMGYVEIPTINVTLPIYHGTDESSLNRGTGHLLGSSLPIGGKGCHCVITGHSGLAGQKMFSDLDQLKLGDGFYLKTLDETLAYMVLNISTVLPEDTSKLSIDPAQDTVTLVTCTPYGVNTHRLLVQGQRIELPTAKHMVEQADFQETPAKSTWTHEYLRGIAYGGLGIAGLLALTAILFKLSKEAGERRELPEAKMEKPSRQRKRGKHEA